VVEINPEVAELVGRHLDDDRVEIHIGDAYTQKWPRGTKWDLAWHDVWPTVATENLPEMRRLIRRYRAHTDWQECWQRGTCMKMERLYQMAKAGKLSPEQVGHLLEGRFGQAL
jgi:hypothetical protein